MMIFFMEATGVSLRVSWPASPPRRDSPGQQSRLPQAVQYHHVVFVPLADFDVPEHELLALLDIDGGLALLHEAGSHGDQQAAGVALDDDLGRGAHAGPQPRIQILQRGPRRERSSRSCPCPCK